MMKHTHKYVKHELQQHHLQLTGMFCECARPCARVFPFYVPNSENVSTYQRLHIYSNM